MLLVLLRRVVSCPFLTVALLVVSAIVLHSCVSLNVLVYYTLSNAIRLELRLRPCVLVLSLVVHGNYFLDSSIVYLSLSAISYMADNTCKLL